ncbi:MAG: tetratricopeptide repeat protein [Betaproteobacteria bacterium]
MNRRLLPPRPGAPAVRSLVAAAALAWTVPAALAQQPAAPAAPPAAEAPASAPQNSILDDRLFYQLLVGEIALTQGDLGTAYTWILDAARRTRDDGLFRRSVDIAIQARSADQALAAARAWRLARPENLEPLSLQVQLLTGTGRAGEITEPLRSLLEQTPAAERAGLIASLPRFLQRANDAPLVARLLDDVLKPHRDRPETAVAARVAQGRAWMEAKDPARALALAREAQSLEAGAPGPALLALELMRDRPEAEALVRAHLAAPGAEPAVRQTYARVLTSAQRYADAVAQLELATKAQPLEPGPYLTLGALHLELKHPAEGEAALRRFIELVGAPAGAGAAGAAAAPDDRLEQAWLMLAQAAEMRGDFKAAEGWLARIADPDRLLEVQTRRASMMAREGRVREARALIRALPERGAEDARAKLQAEAGVLREVKRWKDAHEVLTLALQRFGDDTGLLYETAMMAERLDRMAEMETLLRRVIALKPEDAHAHNALGYSLADRGQRLPEARQLIERALQLSPGDPFITDSLGWVEFRLGNKEEALRLLRQAYASRPDTEIGAHLGEVLWALGQRDEARRIWRESTGRDAANEVLRETLARLRVDL